MSKIIYPLPEGGFAILMPSDKFDIIDVARKDVPADTPYLIVEDDQFPPDRAFRTAWEADFSSPDGNGIGADAWFAEKAAAEAERLAAEQAAAEQTIDAPVEEVAA